MLHAIDRSEQFLLYGK